MAALRAGTARISAVAIVILSLSMTAWAGPVQAARLSWVSGGGDSTVYDHDADRSIYLTLNLSGVGSDPVLTVQPGSIVNPLSLPLQESSGNLSIIFPVGDADPGHHVVTFVLSYRDTNGVVISETLKAEINYVVTYTIAPLRIPQNLTSSPAPISFSIFVRAAMENVTMWLQESTCVSVLTEPYFFHKLSPGNMTLEFEIAAQEVNPVIPSDDCVVTFRSTSHIDGHALLYISDVVQLELKPSIDEENQPLTWLIGLTLVGIVLVASATGYVACHRKIGCRK